MKRLLFTLFLSLFALVICAQIESTGLSGLYEDVLHGCALEEDTLFTYGEKGVYSYDLKKRDKWEMFCETDNTVHQFYKNKNIVIIAFLNSDGTSWTNKLHISEDYGNSFREITTPGFADFIVYNEKIYLSSTERKLYSTLGAVYVSEDLGQNWERMSWMIDDYETNTLRGRPTICKNPYDDIFYVYGPISGIDGIFSYFNISYDGLKSFEHHVRYREILAPSEDVDAQGEYTHLGMMAFTPKDKNTILITTSRGLDKTSDGGITWRTSLDVCDQENGVTKSVLFDALNPEVAYTPLYNKNKGGWAIYYTKDMGDTWDVLLPLNPEEGNELNDYFLIYLFCSSGNYLYFTDIKDVYRIDVSSIQTGISSVSAEGNSGDGFIYDLQGRRLNAEPSHGIYIKDGKKVAR